MNTAGDSFGWAFRDPNWAGKMLLQGLIAIIPIVGWIAMTGWLMMSFENARAGRNELPPAGFHLARGIGIFGVFFIYGLALQVPGWVLEGVGAAISSNSQGGNAGGGALTALGYLWGFLAGLFLNFLVPSLIVNVFHGGFAGAFDFQRVWRLATVNLSNGIVAGLLVFVASLIGGLGAIVCLIGLIFTVPYQNTIQAGVAAWFERVQGALLTPAAAPPAPMPGSPTA